MEINLSDKDKMWLGHNKKGFAFTLDALAAAFLFSLLLGLLLLHSSKTDDFLSKLYLSRGGSDLIRILESNGALDSLDQTIINNEIQNISANSNLKLNITYSDTALQQKNNLILGGDPGTNDFAASGKRFFIAKNSTDITHFAVARYLSWRQD